MEGVHTKATIMVDAYRVIARAVEEGVKYGWNRAHKHTDNPRPDHVQSEIESAVMNSLSEVIIWPERP